MLVSVSGGERDVMVPTHLTFVPTALSVAVSVENIFQPDPHPIPYPITPNTLPQYPTPLSPIPTHYTKYPTPLHPIPTHYYPITPNTYSLLPHYTQYPTPIHPILIPHFYPELRLLLFHGIGHLQTTWLLSGMF